MALSNDSILKIKEYKSNKIIMKAKILNGILTFKFICYFIISFLFLVSFWYYISMFDVIYRNTQMHLFKDTLMSLGLSLLMPFAIYLVPGIFRIPSLKNGKRKCLFNFSKILQSFFDYIF